MTKKEFKQVQKDLKFTNQQMADLIGVHLGTIKKWHSGERKILNRMSRLIRLHTIIKVLFGKETEIKG